MNGRHFSFGASRNPFAQLLSLVILGVALVGAAIMGAFVLMALLGFAVIGFIVFFARAWWISRKLRRGAGAEAGRSGTSIRYIEGEFEVIDPDAEAERRRSRERD